MLFLLLVTFQVKHLLADYLLQNRYMLGKFDPGWSFVGPLAAHAAVHTALTLAVCLTVNPALWWLALLDGTTHFLIDRLKAGPRWLGRFNDKQTAAFWWVLGADQMLHHLVHYAVIYCLVML